MTDGTQDFTPEELRVIASMCGREMTFIRQVAEAVPTARVEQAVAMVAVIASKADLQARSRDREDLKTPIEATPVTEPSREA